MSILQVGDLLPDRTLSRFYVFPSQYGLGCFDSTGRTTREISFGELSKVWNNPSLLIRTLEERLGLDGLALEIVFTGLGKFSPSYK